MDSNFNYQKREGEIYKNWEEKGYFKCEIREGEKPFVISMPPPNVTSKLHIGHALVDAIQDVFIRYHRLKGEPTLWIPGTDHASIATEVKVVEKLKKEGKTKAELGREGFLKEAWAWKEKYGGEITQQIRKLGCSCDWSRERFTMDEGCSDAVLEVFERLYNKGLIYKGKRIVNWCPNCKTPISDIEVDYEEVPSSLWYIKYPLENSDEYLTVATTRPETMLGDTAVAVAPDDERYKKYVGKRVYLPIVGKYIPVIADRYVEKDFGTGVVKMTPAHDPNDYKVGERHNLEIINILNDDATLNENAGKYQGMTTIEAREKIVEELKEQGYLVKIEPYTHNVGSCYRCHTTIEPYISNQWFVRMQDLVKPAIEAVKNDETMFVPKRFEKMYFNWMENIEDWCISRQLWWGHRIPAYYCDKCDKITVSKTPVTTCECGGHLTQDEDTLDTWFSSALWPFSILGWPNKTKDLEYFYPNSMLVTGYDIITFWVSKMIFSGIEYMGEVPFKHVFINGLVRDAKGRKMSKSLGNGVDPLDIIRDYGTDALRLSLIQNITPGNDVRYIPEKVEASRNFVNKLWNAARFANNYIEDLDIDKPEMLMPEDKWILTKLSNTIKNVEQNMDNFEIGIAVQLVYDFIWNDICDWYIEMIKPRLYDKENKSYKTAIWTLNHVLISAAKMLHPFMPFVTEEVYLNLKSQKESIMLALWPKAEYEFAEEEKAIDIINDMIRQIRNARANMNITGAKKTSAQIVLEKGKFEEIFKEAEEYFKKLAYIENIEYLDSIDDANTKYVALHDEKINVFLNMSDAIDLDAEIAKLEKEKQSATSELKRAQGMLKNENFVKKAPEKLIQAEKEKVEKYTDLLEKIELRLNELK